MENFRTFLWVGLLMLLYLSFQAWQQTFAPPAPPTTASTDNKAATVPATEPGQLAAPDPSNALPALPASEASTSPASSSAPEPAPVEPPLVNLIHVKTDVLDLAIDPRGGNIVEARLPTYPIHKDQPDVAIELLSTAPESYFAFQGGLRAADGQPEANHLAAFTASATDYELAPGATEIKVPLRWESATGVVVTKTYVFRPGLYQIGLEYTVENKGTQPYNTAEYLQLQRLFVPHEQSMFNVDSYSFNGPVAYDGTKYQKIDVEDLTDTPFSQTVSQGWFAAIQHHFLAAAVPPGTENWRYEARFNDGKFLVSAIGPLQVIQPAGSARFSSQLFIGPKLQGQLAATAPDLEKAVDYGKLSILAQPMFWLLDKVHGVVHNWGVTIILVTFLIKLVFYKLSETSGRSMAGMRKLQPRMKALQERYKDDRQG
ncbi:MAG: membrane protein insertase YidC, partial [Gammaproteobacteria bacterium]|nr:membrane protein insertase YidC [Gammaproteobacteria bacterium]